jgi:NAD(P)-dependent dehydrogenase (short-subunit alcohol dehydrogenase family)
MSRSDEASNLAEELGGVGIEGSVAEEPDLHALVDKTLDAYGCVDAVVNSAGHPPTGDILDITDKEWHAGLDLVLLNVVRMRSQPSSRRPPSRLLFPTLGASWLHQALHGPLRSRGH